MNNINELSVINPAEMRIIPTQEELTMLRDELSDMDKFQCGRVQIAGGGANVFKVTEPGDEESKSVPEITGVIMYHHKTNALWEGEYGKNEDRTPVCSSVNGDEGTMSETGEILKCGACPYNQYGTAGDGRRGKACKNMRRLYIMRPGDIFPMILSLPPSALGAFDKYRTKVIMARKSLQGVVTRFTLKCKDNRDGVEFSLPVFEAVAALPPGEAERVRQYGEQFNAAASKVGITSDDYGPTERYERGEGYDVEPSFDPPATTPADEEFTPIDEAGLPPVTKTGRKGA